ncbi:KxYKxGKxW signal peptide domain-containing protein [Secundilactobacillus paracollinoides]|uniref:KxYKxGKxW signal peptide domain-containing protein n=1 Tax=Secundilactobacillus paracollinoides TaxID=240427 RepID=UPI0006EE76C3|nr:KxYKxGKxW signal peptide domain-containing protein [Secundilactobacillus paracollinoides]KRL80955.1 hypothetical protein FC17_GL002769 [Secundilactobacillus paracollinoides DSM 15502 = JCM 11969]
MQATTERKHHVKLYKAGKLWLAAGITTAAMGIAAISGGVVANADSTGEPASGETTSVTNDSDLTVTKSLTLNSASSPEDSQADPVSNGNETPDPDGNAAQEGTGSEQSQSEQLEQGNTDTGQSDPDEPGTPGQGDKGQNQQESNEGSSVSSSFTSTTPADNPNESKTIVSVTIDQSNGARVNTYSDGSTKEIMGVADNVPDEGQIADTSVDLTNDDPASISPVTEEDQDLDATPTTIHFTLVDPDNPNDTQVVDLNTGENIDDITGRFNSAEVSDELASELTTLEGDGYILADNGYEDALKKAGLTETTPNITLGEAVNTVTALVQKSIDDYNAANPGANLKLIGVVDGKTEGLYTDEGDGYIPAKLIYEVYSPQLLTDDSTPSLGDVSRTVTDGATLAPTFGAVNYVLNAYNYMTFVSIGSNDTTTYTPADGSGAILVGTFSKLHEYAGDKSISGQFNYEPSTYNITLSIQREIPEDPAGTPDDPSAMQVFTKVLVPAPVTATGKTPEDSDDGVPGTTPIARLHKGERTGFSNC